MKKVLFILFLAIPFNIYSQFYSWEGNGIANNAKIRCLNIFVNIIYDIHPDTNVYSNNEYWPEITDTLLEGVNNAAIPIYLLDWLDTAYISGQTHGSTRLYGESSFDTLQLTGDFIIVNIRESTILKNDDFGRYGIPRAVFRYLNNYGFTTVYHHDILEDYDRDHDGDLDFVNILIRNISKEYGNLGPGCGYNRVVHDGISLSDKSLFHRTVQCVGDGDFFSNPTNIVTHEISHELFGSNDFHTSGGNHRGWGCPMPFVNIQYGYGLMGAAGASLVCCNGYERWRMHWKHPQAVNYIAARDSINSLSIVSDISKNDGSQTFLLRDFITYGDVVRIGLPYKDSITSSNQYIWLENHQVGINGKLDFLQYSNQYDCRPSGAAGIYAYYQIGRDILEGTKYEVWDTCHRDNLKIIPAEGYYDYEMVADTYQLQCVNYGFLILSRLISVALTPFKK